jgi:hypothetical protein
MSTRKLSEVQFEDGVVIAGNRVDKFLDDTVNRLNLLPPSDDKSSWVQQSGFSLVIPSVAQILFVAR